MSIKPKYADLILQGCKTVELRRSWAAQPVCTIVIYASSPVQKLVGVVAVREVKDQSINELWKTSQAHGGGLTRKELQTYYLGKRRGLAIMLGDVKSAQTPADPKELLPGFTPPQSFRYLDEAELKSIEQKLFSKRAKK
ncbi:MAG: ASCH domain-containing protein [Pseudomonadota bacterium]